ncbi:hypothetical protein FHR70_002885 [Microvirga lupini]|uniref:Uncharacterized protein n=1 Tax=Microvirga lupini TaxID=420324 RepID=A0A7W4YWU5_9HYPH|nr:hypothetical protein [Microvirga lupini]MBB3019820.1 hypothetical protein [Microvirga lupini]
MLSALEQAYLDFMRHHGGQISMGYVGAQAGTGTGGVDGAGPIVTTQNGRIDTGNGIKEVVVREDGTQVARVLVDGLEGRLTVLVDGTATYSVTAGDFHYTVTEFPDGARAASIGDSDVWANGSLQRMARIPELPGMVSMLQVNHL